MPRYAKLIDLAAALGKNKGQVSAWTRRPWFPAQHRDGWDLDEVRRALAANVAPAPGRARPGNTNRADGAAAAAGRPPVSADRGSPPPAPRAPAPPAAGVAPPPELVEADAPLLRRLEGSDDPVELARAALQLAARRLARNLATGWLGAKDFENLKRTLEELRRAEADYLQLARERGELIPREAACATMGALARRFVLACERLEVRLAAQVELWLADEKLRGLGVEERGREVRAWAARQLAQARLGETETEARAEVARMVAAELTDREA